MRRSLFGAALGTLLLASGLHAQTADSAIVIGHAAKLHSSILGEDRAVAVYLPPSYGQAGPEARYPVLYLLDGDAHFHHSTGVVQFLASNGRMPEMIVIAVPNTQRTRDLTPRARTDSIWLTTMQGEQRHLGFPDQGGADAFLRFLTDELAPWVDARYQTAPYRVLVGHSFGGLFAIHALLTRPTSFNGYISVSPSLWWDERRLIEDAPAALARGDYDRRFLFMTMGTEGPNMNDNIEHFAQVLRERAPKGFQWAYQPLPEDNHGTTPHRTLYDGLEALFKGWELPYDAIMAGDIPGVDAHFTALDERFGFVGKTPEAVLNQMGYAQLQSGNPKRAVEIFRENVARYPQSANVYDSFGDGLMATGAVAEAAKQYETAVRLGEATSHASLAVFRNNLETARKRLADSD